MYAPIVQFRETGTADRLQRLSIVVGVIATLGCIPGCDKSDRDYDQAFQADAIDGFQEVLEKHPQHARAQEARSRIGELRWQHAKQTRDPVKLERLLRDYPEADFAGEAAALFDDVSWKASLELSTAQSYTRYKARFPTGKYLAEADKQLDLLAWEAARSRNTTESYEDYCTRFQEGQHIAQARMQIEELAWQAARARNTPQEYADYSTRFPDGRYVDQAGIRIEELSWKAAIEAESIEELERFTARFPNSVRKKEAGQRIEQLRKQAHAKIFEDDDVSAYGERDNGTLEQTLGQMFAAPPLVLAAAAGSQRIAEYLIEKGADPNVRSADQATALHVAVRSGAMVIVKLLLEHEADINAGIRKQSTQLKFGEGGSATYTTTPPTALKGTPMHWAVEYNRPSILAYLLEQGADPNVHNGYGEMPLHFAARLGRTDMIKTLVAAGADWRKNPGKSSSSTPPSPLHYAKTVEIADYFINDGVAIDHFSSGLGDPIHLASYRGNIEVVEHLLELGVRIDDLGQWEGNWVLKRVEVTPAWAAAAGGQTEIIKELKSRGANLLQILDDTGSLLHAAAMGGHIGTLEYLIDQALPVDALGRFPNALPLVKDWERITPLGVAVHYGQMPAVKTLIKAGAHVNLGFPNDHNALTLAIIGRDPAMVAYLLEKGADRGPNTHITNWNTTDEINDMLRKHFKTGASGDQEGKP